MIDLFYVDFMRKIGGTIMKTAFFVEAYGKQVEEKDIVAAIKELWVADGNKVKDIKTLNIYAKPEDNAVYYMINDETEGKLELFN